MKKITIILAAVILLINFSFAQVKLGEEITLNEKTNVSDILEQPESFVGKTVLVEGEILDVCKMAGCWMEISSGENQIIKIKVKDGDIVFPVEAIGKKAVVEGEVYELKMDQARAIAYYEHIADENGYEFDPATVTGPVTLYQVRGVGAVIESLEDTDEAKN